MAVRQKQYLMPKARSMTVDQRVCKQNASGRQPELHDTTFEQQAALGQLDENRALSAVVAFFIFKIGVGSGVLWTSLFYYWFFP